MQEIKLTDLDYQTIKAMALNEWRDKAIEYKNPNEFVCKCYVQATITFCNSKGYIKDGKLYVK